MLKKTKKIFCDVYKEIRAIEKMHAGWHVSRSICLHDLSNRQYIKLNGKTDTDNVRQYKKSLFSYQMSHGVGFQKSFGNHYHFLSKS